MSKLEVLLSITSTLFRFLSFVFLRIIPLHHCTKLLPLLYMTYASLFFLTSDSVNNIGTKEHLDKKDSARNDSSHTNTRPPTRFFNLSFALALTLPSSSDKLRKLSLLINSLLLLLVADFITHPIRHSAHDVTFVRVGAVDHRSAKLSVRYPGSNSTDSYAVQVLFRPASGNMSEQARWLEGPLIELFEQEDWVNVTRLSNLWPSTTYEYKLAIPDSNQDLSYPSAPLRFETFPDPRLTTGSHFRFIASSCILPNFPYVPGKGDQIKGFDLLAEALYHEPAVVIPDGSSTAQSSSSQSASDIPDNEPVASSHTLDESKDSPLPGDQSLTKFLLLLGDFIYADVPVYFGNSLEAYRRLYRRVYASPSFRKVYERLPTLNIYDDHEILNNFSGLENDTFAAFPNASNAFEQYNARANHDSKDKDKYYYDFRYGDVAFFVLDARRHRSSTLESHPTMLGDQQFQALLSWLAEANQTSTFKFIVSSVPFTTLWQLDAQIDTWAAFRRERSILLETLHTVPNLFILSGDRHEFAAIEFNGPLDWSHPIYEFSTSPLNMFYMPIFRTLQVESSEHVERTRKVSQVTEEDGTPVITEEKYQIPEERVIQYSPLGNHKWTSFEIDTRDSSRPSITAELMIDGRLAYRWSKTGTPVAIRRTLALNLFIPQSLHTVLDKFGFGSRNWF